MCTPPSHVHARVVCGQFWGPAYFIVCGSCRMPAAIGATWSRSTPNKFCLYILFLLWPSFLQHTLLIFRGHAYVCTNDRCGGHLNGVAFHRVCSTPAASLGREGQLWWWIWIINSSDCYSRCDHLLVNETLLWLHQPSSVAELCEPCSWLRLLRWIRNTSQGKAGSVDTHSHAIPLSFF